jgi:hypothetical protein
MRSWGELKAAYRLMAQQEVTFERLSMPHWLNTRDEAGARDDIVLFIQDGSDLDFSTQRSKVGLGPLGNTEAYGLGLLLHSCLAVVPSEAGEILGLAHQRTWARQKQIHRGNETRVQRYRRRTEYDVWAETLEAIGPVPEHSTWVSVGDRGSDVFSYLRRGASLGWDCLLRVGQDRRVQTVSQEKEGESRHLFELLRSLPGRADTKVAVRGRAGKKERTASLKVDWSAVQIMPPRNRPQEQTAGPIHGWCVRAWEEDQSADGLEWMLFCTLPITDADSALEKIHWYTQRWIIEEYHKSLKSGCRMESRQLRSAAGIERLLGFLGIIAVRLLQLREVSRSTPELPAIEAVPEMMVRIVAQCLEVSERMSLGQFWRNVARIGGFIGRKSDGDPGWQTLWKGWLRVVEMHWAAEFALEQGSQNSKITRQGRCG